MRTIWLSDDFRIDIVDQNCWIPAGDVFVCRRTSLLDLWIWKKSPRTRDHFLVASCDALTDEHAISAVSLYLEKEERKEPKQMLWEYPMPVMDDPPNCRCLPLALEEPMWSRLEIFGNTEPRIAEWK